ncbi:MAG: hydantoinase/oxoprolinase family protein [Longimicrobiales bacterium]|nr:hydantoinase/oxoprolinase family protein [Longimicrobiales bacterium]
MRRIGIDVGGTNTDAVLIGDSGVLAAVKTPTTENVTGGIRRALADLLALLGGDAGRVDAVMVGTTHFTNAVVQRRDLEAVAALRIGLPSGRSLPPFVDWPEDLAAIARGGVFMVAGGHEVDGRPLVPFDEAATREAAARIRDLGIRSVAVSAVFSPLTPECEVRAADILLEVIPGVSVTLSHDLGRIGLLERENAALLNAALVSLARRTTRAFSEALEGSGIQAPLYLTQNDGTVMRADFADAFPVYSFSSGPTNSMRGAAYLSGLTDAMVVDVGGTTTDIGHLKAGFPREANRAVEVGGVRTLFRMPDLLSLGLGGGSLVDTERRTVGPRSVGYRLTRESRVFGGETLTATDVAVAAGLADIGDASRVAGMGGEIPRWALERCRTLVEEGVDRMKIDAAPLPLLAVGGGAFLVPASLPGISEVLHVPHAGVANAVGAAIAQVSGEVDQVFSGLGRERALAEAERIARSRAVEAGAAEATLSVVEAEDIPLAYLPGDALRVRVRVVGDARGS